MRLRLTVFLLLPLFLVGCGSGAYKMPKDEYRERVRTLGVLPLMIDNASTITHPERQRIIDLLRNSSADRENQLTDELRARKGYFDVRTVSGDPQRLFQQLVSGSSIRGRGDKSYRRYHFDARTATEIASSQVVDALLVIVLNGIERTEKRYDRGPFLTYLEAPYNSIIATAAVVLPSGEIAWEHSGRPGEAFLALQYPAFDEAHYNKTDEVHIKYISLAGLERTLAQIDSGLLDRSSTPRVYRNLFKEIAGAMDPGLLLPLRGKGEEGAPAVQPAK